MAPAALVAGRPTVKVASEGSLPHPAGTVPDAPRGPRSLRAGSPSAGHNAVRLALGTLRVSSLLVTPDRGVEGGSVSPRRTGFSKALTMGLTQDAPGSVAGVRGDGGRERRSFLKCQLTQNCLDFGRNALAIFKQHGGEVGSEAGGQGTAGPSPLWVICSARPALIAHGRGGDWAALGHGAVRALEDLKSHNLVPKTSVHSDMLFVFNEIKKNKKLGRIRGFEYV